MPNCVKCHQPQTAAPVICRSCYRALTERTVSVESDKLEEYKRAIERQGLFGRRFLEYRGCLRGAIGRMGLSGGELITHHELLSKEVLSQAPITDVDGGSWIPVIKEALREMVGEYKAQATENATLRAQLAEKDKQLAAAVEENDFRKFVELTPLYTRGGHDYLDDDDEDFWCPVCHEHLGRNRHDTTCPRCGQAVNSDAEPCWDYDELRRTEYDQLPKNWEGGPQEAGEVSQTRTAPAWAEQFERRFLGGEGGGC